MTLIPEGTAVRLKQDQKSDFEDRLIVWALPSDARS
jgi:hypothetical protein